MVSVSLFGAFIMVSLDIGQLFPKQSSPDYIAFGLHHLSGELPLGYAIFGFCCHILSSLHFVTTLHSQVLSA